ncbi:beta-propeller fold lactonase family protein [Mycolicibacterium sphagni]|uniref:beta-propeller fold lactonase family protein n=1 Tax=Mycolicibacterium sphagni TaxID=1786 RepID=UPI0013FDA41F|nr:beta-propeller fold lactonase family protein [Mycolicibacterium sphagni]
MAAISPALAGATTTAAGLAPAASASVAAPTPMATTIASGASTPLQRLSTLVTKILALIGLSSSQPTAPAGAPLLWGLLAFVRREAASVMSDGELSASPVQISQSLTGVVIGSVNLTNPYTDPVKYTVTDQPANGTVVINPNGTYTYTPDAEMQGSGGLDQFTVRISDTGFHLFDNSSITVKVSVAVTPPSTAITNPEGTGAKSIVLSSNGQRAFVLNTDNTISVIDTNPSSATKNQVIDVIPVTTTVTDPGTGQTSTFVPTVTALATDSTGSTIYLTTSATYQPSDTDAAPITTNTLTKITIAAGIDGALANTIAGVIDTSEAATAVAVSSDGSRVYLLSTDGTTNNAGTVSVIDPTQISGIDTSPGAILSTVAVGNGGSAIQVDAGGKVYVANTSDDTVSIINPVTSTVSTVAVGGEPDAIAFGPGPGGTGSRAYVANYLSNSVSVIDTNPADSTYDTVIANITTGGEPSAITVSPDGTHVYVAESYTNSVAIIDTVTNTVTTRLDTSADGGPSGIALSPGGTTALVTNLASSIIDQVALTPTLTPGSTSSSQLLGSTKGFQVYNFAGEAATLGGYLGKGTLQSPAPAPGTVVAPGSYIDFEVVIYSGHNNTVQPYFLLPQPNGGPLSTSLSVVLKNVNVTRHIASCGVHDGDQCKAIPGYKVALLDPPGTVVNLDASQSADAQQISQTLKDLCDNNALGTCDFTADPNRQQVLLSKPKIVGAIIYNNTGSPETVSSSYSAAKSQTNSISFEFSANFTVIKDKINLGIKATYGHVWTNTYTFTQTVTYQLQPSQWGWVDAEVPVYRDWGNFTIDLGNTTWNITNVYFDSPDDSGNSFWSPTTSSSPPTSDALDTA